AMATAHHRETDKLAAQNRRARHDYFIEDTVEAGVMLLGTEVKSLRAGRASIAESFAAQQGDGLYLVNAYIPEYEAANRFNHAPKRARKLLLHRRELGRLLGAVQREGMTLVPLSIYSTARGMPKPRLGPPKDKQKGDRRGAERERDGSRARARLLRDRG